MIAADGGEHRQRIGVAVLGLLAEAEFDAETGPCILAVWLPPTRWRLDQQSRPAQCFYPEIEIRAAYQFDIDARRENRLLEVSSRVIDPKAPGAVCDARAQFVVLQPVDIEGADA